MDDQEVPKQIKIAPFFVYLRMKQINSRDLTVDLFKLEANKQSQHEPHESKKITVGFCPT